MVHWTSHFQIFGAQNKKQVLGSFFKLAVTSDTQIDAVNHRKKKVSITLLLYVVSIVDTARQE